MRTAAEGKGVRNRGATEAAGEGAERDTPMLDDATRANNATEEASPVDGSGRVGSEVAKALPLKPKFSPLSAKQLLGGKTEFRKVPIPPHRYTPLKEHWMEIYTPVFEQMKIDIRFNLKVFINSTVLSASGAPDLPVLTVLSAGVGNFSAVGPTFNLTTGANFAVEQKFGRVGAWWSAPSATWQSVTGYIESGGGFDGGPVANANVSSTLAAFGGASGFLTTAKSADSNQSFLSLFVNSTMEIDPRK